MTIMPKVRAMPTWLILPPVTSFITIAHVPSKTNAKVSISSARYFRMFSPGKVISNRFHHYMHGERVEEAGQGAELPQI
jgi:hypothetical protein